MRYASAKRWRRLLLPDCQASWPDPLPPVSCCGLHARQGGAGGLRACMPYSCPGDSSCPVDKFYVRNGAATVPTQVLFHAPGERRFRNDPVEWVYDGLGPALLPQVRQYGSVAVRPSRTVTPLA